MLKVLIAEDNILLADLLGDYLTSQNYDVCGLAHTVDEAVALADLHKPDIAVFDFRLSNGEFGSQIRERMQDKKSMAIIYVSGDPLDNKLSREDGDAYIQKPYGMKDLSRALQIVAEMKQQRDVSNLVHPKGFHLLEKARSQAVL